MKARRYLELLFSSLGVFGKRLEKNPGKKKHLVAAIPVKIVILCN